MKELSADVSKRIQSWLDGAYDEETRAQIRALLDEKRYEELTDAFYKDLEFGTGGLRGVMGIGTNRMNRYTVAMATQGLSNYLKKVYPDEQVKAVIARDNRNNADTFARVVAEVFSANGIYVYYFEELRPTPELSFAIRHLDCHTGVMLTASHNPKEYSGYKAYWYDGGQVIPPHDREIIAEVKSITRIEQVRSEPVESGIEVIGPEVDEPYMERLLETVLRPGAISREHELGIVFSPIHGAGVKLVPETLRRAGFTRVQLVEEQCETDGNFPTVVYPNPEEKEALTMAIEQAEESGADLVMATDPDADRVGVVARNRDGEYELLDGNQTAALLFHYQIEGRRERGELRGDEYVVKTIVTSYLLDRIAERAGVECHNVLTGFKYIGELMTRLEGEKKFLVGGEESYGYLVGDHVRDKDAVVSCLAVAEMAAWYKSNGKTLHDALREIHYEYGLYRERLVSLTRKGKRGADEIRGMMERFRTTPPAELGGAEIVTLRDYLDGRERNLAGGDEKSIDLPSSHVLQFVTGNGDVISVRPSGTEPKIKFYVSVNATLRDGDDYRAAVARLEKRIDAIASDLGV